MNLSRLFRHVTLSKCLDLIEAYQKVSILSLQTWIVFFENIRKMDIKKINNKGIFDTSNNTGNSFVTSHRNLSSFGLTSPLSTVPWISIVEHRKITALIKQCHKFVHISFNSEIKILEQ